MIKIGVVCEGITDFVAIENFLGASLESNGVYAEFCLLQPDRDNTLPAGGWGNVISWLRRNPPAAREIGVFGGGLFSISSASFDVLLIQMDSDVLDEAGFINHVADELCYTVQGGFDAHRRAQEVRAILQRAAQFDEMTHEQRAQHILAPSVEATESWCVAAFKMPTEDFEVLRGQALTDEFMSAIHLFEGRQPTPPYERCDKTVQRRKRFCRSFVSFHQRIADGCSQFRNVRDELLRRAGA